MRSVFAKLEGCSSQFIIQAYGFDELIGLGATTSAYTLLTAAGYGTARVTQETKDQLKEFYKGNEELLRHTEESPMGDVVYVLDDIDNMNLKENSMAMFWHEVGHIELGHLDTVQEDIKESCFEIEGSKILDNQQREIDADAFAAERVGYHRLLCAIVSTLNNQAKVIKAKSSHIIDGPVETLAANILAEFRSSERYQELLKYTEGY